MKKLRTKSGNSISNVHSFHTLKDEVPRRWYIVASRARALVFGEDHCRLVSVDELKNPSALRSEGELDSDRSGNKFNHALDRRHSRREQVARRFAKKLGRLLGKAENEGKFTELVVAAEPHFLGLLRAELSEGVKKRVTHEVRHEIRKQNTQEVEDYLKRAIAA